MIVRDTRGAALDHAQRFNFFPASPLCCLSWTIAGDLHFIASARDMEHPESAARLPHFMLSGAQLGPLVSWTPGETYTVTVAFYPDAFAAMTGLDLSAFAGRMMPAQSALPEHILAACQEFSGLLRHSGAHTAYARFEKHIGQAWSDVRPAGSKPVQRLKDWTVSLVVRAALSGPGRSSRQIARRIKSWTGISERDLRGLGQTEQLYANIYEAAQSGRIDWAEVAAASGFADQGHMIRRLRQHTGFTPEQLRRVTPSDESLWAYRLLGQYFTRT